MEKRGAEAGGTAGCGQYHRLASAGGSGLVPVAVPLRGQTYSMFPGALVRPPVPGLEAPPRPGRRYRSATARASSLPPARGSSSLATSASLPSIPRQSWPVVPAQPDRYYRSQALQWQDPLHGGIKHLFLSNGHKQQR
jgi:hypothetical protein